MIICSIIGAITGGTFVAVCMALALAGGVVATIGVKNDRMFKTKQAKLDQQNFRFVSTNILFSEIH